jgi:hypothetical protein
MTDAPMETPAPTWVDIPDFGRFFTLGKFIGIALALLLVTLTFLLILGIFGGILAAMGLRGATFGFAFAGIVLILTSGAVIVWYQGHREQVHSTRHLLPAERIRLLESGLKSMSGLSFAKSLARDMARCGQTNVIIRLIPATGEPIRVPFEPIAWQLCGATSAADNSATAFPDEQLARTPQHQFARILALGGGWPMLACFSLMIAGFAWEAFQRGTIFIPPVIAGLVGFLLGWVAKLTLPGGRGSSQAGWRVLPGGILSAGAPLWPRPRLFRRTESTVIAFQFTRRTWGIAIANAAAAEYMMGTQAEVEFALRALASPIPPPSLESLAQLA